ncbi:MAG: HAD hydrolase-like protein [archaeon]
MIKTIIFDMDGVIVDSLKDHFDGWEYAMKMQGIVYQRSLDEKLNGMTLSDSIKNVRREIQVAQA